MRKMVKICCSLLLLSLLNRQLNANPGLKVRITQKGLEYGMCDVFRSCWWYCIESWHDRHREARAVGGNDLITGYKEKESLRAQYSRYSKLLDSFVHHIDIHLISDIESVSSTLAMTRSEIWNSTAGSQMRYRLLSDSVSIPCPKPEAQNYKLPGSIKGKWTDHYFPVAKEVGLEILKQNMAKEHFPDLSGYEKFGLGNVKYNISR